jgi:hypothetical protein
VCENERGARWASHLSWTTVEFSREEAESKAEAFRIKVECALLTGSNPTTSSKWTAIQGMYGSAAWSESEEVENEARDLESEGYGEDANRLRNAHMMSSLAR